MTSKVQRYFLEIKNFDKPIDLNLPKNHTIVLDDKKDFQLNKYLYEKIGKKDLEPAPTLDFGTSRRNVHGRRESKGG